MTINASAQTTQPATAHGAVDFAEVEERARLVSHLLQAHGGGIDVRPSSKLDTVIVRFTGLCTACSLRPLTVANIITPAFDGIQGLRDVEVDGCRVSAAALERLAGTSR